MFNIDKRTNKTKTLFAVIAVALAGMVAMPALAAAQQLEPTGDQYEDTRGQIVTLAADGGDPNGDPPGTGDPGSSQVGSLPFSGLDVLGLLAIAVAVAGAGLVLQRVVSRESSPLE